MDIAPIDKLRLRFPDDLEQAFQEDYFQKSLNQLRLGIVLGALLYALFGLLDAWIFPEVKAQTWFIRYAIVLPACAAILLFSYSRHFKKYMQVTVFIVIVVAGAGIIAMMVIVQSPVNYFHFAGLLLIIMYSYTFSKLKFLYTALASWAVVGMYEATALGISHTPLPVLLNDNFFYIAANLIGMFSSYHRELYMRKDFFQNRMVQELQEKKYALEKLRLNEARIAEEKRHLREKEKILMDLHDGIGGITTNIGILSEVAQKATDVESIKKTLFTISQLSREGISEVRNFMQSLDDRELTWRTLATELRTQGAGMVEPHNIKLTAETSVDDIQDQPSSLLWVNLFKIYKEALTNIIKHAKAATVAVVLHVNRDRIFLSIRDDGAGWKDARGNGRGVANMKRRAQEIGGTMTLSPGSGTRVDVEIPLPLKYPVLGIE